MNTPVVPPIDPDPKTFAGYFEQIATRRVLVIGDLMLDHYIWGDANRISPEAPVPVVHVQSDTHTAGGAANVALNLAALGIQPVIAGSIGKDPAGDILRRILDQSGVGFLSIDETNLSGSRTIEKTRVLVRNQQLCRIDREGTPQEHQLDLPQTLDAISRIAPTLDGMILSDYGKGVITTALARASRDLCAEQGIPLAYDPKPSRLAPIERIDLLTPNRVEAHELAGMSTCLRGDAEEIEMLAARIHERFAPRNLIITLGAEGMVHCHNGRVIAHFPTYAREVYDVSGAGDTVIAALMAATLIGLSPAQAIPFANCAAGVVVGKVGTATASPEEIIAFAAEHPCSRNR